MKKKWNEYWTKPLTRLSVLVETLVAYLIALAVGLGYIGYILKGDVIKKWFKTKLKKFKKHYIETEIKQ